MPCVADHKRLPLTANQMSSSLATALPPPALYLYLRVLLLPPSFSCSFRPHLLLLFLDSPPTSITYLSCLLPFSKKLLPPTLDILPNLAQTTIGISPHSSELFPADFVRIVPFKKHAMLHSVTINVTVHRCQCGATCHCIGSK